MRKDALLTLGSIPAVLVALLALPSRAAPG